MSLELVGKALAVWMIILVLAIANGVLREALLIPRLGAASGLILSGMLLSCVVLGAAYLFLPWLGNRSLAQFMLIGAGWLILTLIFEFSFGLMRGKALTEILAAYTFKGGNLWPMVLMMTAAAPSLAAKIRGWL